MQKAVDNEDRIGKEISKEKCIASIRRLEEAKIHSIDNINRAARSGKIPQNAVPIILEVDKARSVDKLFFDTEVDNEDIGVTVRRLNLKEDADFKGMMEEIQNKFRDAQASWQQ